MMQYNLQNILTHGTMNKDRENQKFWLILFAYNNLQWHDCNVI